MLWGESKFDSDYRASDYCFITSSEIFMNLKLNLWSLLWQTTEPHLELPSRLWWGCSWVSLKTLTILWFMRTECCNVFQWLNPCLEKSSPVWFITCFRIRVALTTEGNPNSSRCLWLWSSFVQMHVKELDSLHICTPAEDRNRTLYCTIKTIIRIISFEK